MINILENDQAITSSIDPENTDIDINNEGSQQAFYDPAIGSFDLSINGELTIDIKDFFLGAALLKYRVFDGGGLSSSYANVVVIVKPLEDTPPLAYKKLFTPNGDGLNDEFVIGYLNTERPGKLSVIDRLGNLIYEQADYTNDWGFTLDNGDIAQDGQYFFIYDEEQRDLIQGTFVIKRM